MAFKITSYLNRFLIQKSTFLPNLAPALIDSEILGTQLDLNGKKCEKLE